MKFYVLMWQYYANVEIIRIYKSRRSANAAQKRMNNVEGLKGFHIVKEAELL